MKTLLSAYPFEPNRGSESGNGWNWGCFLALRGHEVHIMTKTQVRDAINQELATQNFPNLVIHNIDVPKWSVWFLKRTYGD